MLPAVFPCFFLFYPERLCHNLSKCILLFFLFFHFKILRIIRDFCDIIQASERGDLKALSSPWLFCEQNWGFERGVCMRILLVEDDENLCQTLKYQLEQQGFQVDTCMDGEDSLFYIRERVHDLILLDRMLPSMDGITVLKTLRKEKISTPVLLLTALGELQDKVTGLDCGADDYMVKPFAFAELMARIRCLQRRPRKWESAALLSLGDVTYDIDQKKLSAHGKECSLSKREGDLMEIFLRNPGQILPRQTLLSRVWGPETEVEDGNLDNYIYFLRRRLRSVESQLELKAVRGVGYQLEVYR